MTRRATRWASTCIVACAFLCAIAVGVPARAQQPPQEVRTEAPPSRWQAQVDSLDEAFRARMLTADDPRSNWIAGQLDRGDIASQVRHFAAARVAAPDNKLYLATLATACMEPVQPRLPECESVDRLGRLGDARRGQRLALAVAGRPRAAAPQSGFDARLPAAGGGAAAFRRVLGGGVAGNLGGRARDAGGRRTSRQARTRRHVRDGTLARVAERRACHLHGDRRTHCCGESRLRRTRRSDARTRLDLDVAADRRPDGAGQCRDRRRPGPLPTRSWRSFASRSRRAAVPPASILDGLEAADAATRAKAVAEWDRWLRREAAVGEARACAERVAP